VRPEYTKYHGEEGWGKRFTRRCRGRGEREEEGWGKRFTRRRGDAKGAEKRGGGRGLRGEPSPFGLG